MGRGRGGRIYTSDTWGVVNTFVNSEEKNVNKDEIVLVVAGAKFGAEDEIRTRDILLGKEVLYH